MRGRVPKAPPQPQGQWQATLDDYVQALAWSPDSSAVAAAAIGGPITLFAGHDGTVQHSLHGHGFGTSSLHWSHDGKRLASGGQDGVARVWDAASGTELLALKGGAAWVERVAFAPVGGFLATSAGRSVRLWNAEGTLLREWNDHPSTVADIAWQPGGKEIVAAHYGGLTRYTPANAAPLRRYEWKGSTLVIAWSPNNAIIATGDQDATVHFWYAKSGKDLQMWGYGQKVRELAWSPDSRYLATGGGRAVTVWDTAGPKGPEGTRPLELHGHELPLTALQWQHNGPLLASGGEDGRVVLWNTAKSKRPIGGVQMESRVAQLAWSPDDLLLAIGCENGTVGVLRALP
jgi:WD40 repeat protein